MLGRDVSAVATLLADPSRAAMLDALLAGDDLRAIDLARHVGVSAPTASQHLAKLASGGLVVSSTRGRERWFRLASAEVADAFESLMLLAPEPTPHGLRDVNHRMALRRARTCFDHLAGRLGVEITDNLRAEGSLAGGELRLTTGGEARMADLDIDVEALRHLTRRPLTRACIDGTERRPHVAGAIGAAVAQQLLSRHWLQRQPGTRALRITESGRHELTRLSLIGADACR